MAEEQRWQEGHRLCANDCGFFGSPATLNLCSKCYRDLRLKEDQAASAKIAVEKSLSTTAVAAVPPPPPAVTLIAADPVIGTLGEFAPPAEEEKQQQQQERGSNRCAACRKRVGLTGFRCRCGETYCGAHRYAERHGCSFDYKAVGREAIARANPVVKADKLHRI